MNSEEIKSGQRVIKFRAWDKISNILRNVNTINFKPGYYDYILADPTESAPENWCLRNDNNVVLQRFTGLLDRYKVEIYEGDILKSPSGTIGPVTFENGSFTWKNDPLGWDVEGDRAEVCLPERWAQVIGHIYSLPSLTTTKENPSSGNPALH